MNIVSRYDAKTRLSALVDQAAAGEEIIIAKNGVPQACLVPIAQKGQPRMPVGPMMVTYVADDFDEPSDEINAMFMTDLDWTCCSTRMFSSRGSTKDHA